MKGNLNRFLEWQLDRSDTKQRKERIREMIKNLHETFSRKEKVISSLDCEIFEEVFDWLENITKKHRLYDEFQVELTVRNWRKNLMSRRLLDMDEAIAMERASFARRRDGK